MNKNRNVKICKRLLECAKMIESKSSVVDVGTDHAHLPIYLALKNKISHAIACDLNQKPLNNAKANIKSFGLENIIETRQSNGLENINSDEINSVIIAGMGGNLISKILQDCKWKNKKNKEFIFQPMKYENNLRIYLSEMGYKIEKEVAVKCKEKIYIVMKARYTSKPYKLDPVQTYIGILPYNLNESAIYYIYKQLNDLYNRKKGAIIKGLKIQADYYSNIINGLESLL